MAAIHLRGGRKQPSLYLKSVCGLWHGMARPQHRIGQEQGQEQWTGSRLLTPHSLPPLPPLPLLSPSLPPSPFPKTFQWYVVCPSGIFAFSSSPGTLFTSPSTRAPPHLPFPSLTCAFPSLPSPPPPSLSPALPFCLPSCLLQPYWGVGGGTLHCTACTCLCLQFQVGHFDLMPTSVCLLASA